MALHVVSFIRILALYALCCFRSINLAGLIIILLTIGCCDVMCLLHLDGSFKVVPVYVVS